MLIAALITVNVLLALAVCFLLYRNYLLTLSLETNDVEWSKGLDETEEMYQGMVLTLEENLATSIKAHQITTQQLQEQELSLREANQVVRQHLDFCLPSVNGPFAPGRSKDEQE